jgi:hypothetical protein
MYVMKCQKCGAECPPETSFCRQCGAPVDTGAIRASEQTTQLLEQNDGVTTQRLESRETAGGRGRLPRADEHTVAKTGSSRRALFIGAVVIGIIAVISAAAFIGLRSHRSASSDLIYPGAKTIVDVRTNDGGRALQLETTDSFSDVEAWYQKAINSEKIIRLTPTSTMIKDRKRIATIVADGNKTAIAIKVIK